MVNRELFDMLGPAVNSGAGLFLYGEPGNGKTTLAQRITKCFGHEIWIPQTIIEDGQLIKLYDSAYHEIQVSTDSSILKTDEYDRRWIKIRRPTVIVGGELTMDALEIRYDPVSKISHAPLQMKSNCGSLVIDDFGRQRVNPFELLNRWIVPLEKRYDFLNLPTGKKLEVPFDQLIIFSTNLEPRELVDDAFLRRIPYKIEVVDPTEEEFIELFKIMCPIMGVEFDQAPIQYLIDQHYKPVNRPFRCCQPRDLLLQIKNYCLYNREDLVLSNDKFDFAVDIYFAVM